MKKVLCFIDLFLNKLDFFIFMIFIVCLCFFLVYWYLCCDEYYFKKIRGNLIKCIYVFKFCIDENFILIYKFIVYFFNI